MNSHEMVIEQIEAKRRSLAVAGRALQRDLMIDDVNDRIIDPDTDRAGTQYDTMVSAEIYARNLVIEETENDEGKQILLACGGPAVAAQHVADFDLWYLIGVSSTFKRSHNLDPADQTDSDAIYALNWLIAP